MFSSSFYILEAVIVFSAIVICNIIEVKKGKWSWGKGALWCLLAFLFWGTWIVPWSDAIAREGHRKAHHSTPPTTK